MKEHTPSKEHPSPTFGPTNFLNEIKVYLSECPYCTASFTWLMECACGVWEAKPQARCISEVRNFFYFTESYYKVALHMVNSECYAVSPWLWSHWCITTLHIIAICFNLGHRVNVTWALFVVKCGNIRKSTHPPLWWTCNVLRWWVLLRETMIFIYTMYLYINALHWHIL